MNPTQKNELFLMKTLSAPETACSELSCSDFFCYIIISSFKQELLRMSFQNLQKMALGRSRGADADCFCSEFLVRRNELQNRNLHFDEKCISERRIRFFYKQNEPFVIHFDKKLVNFD